ncbi:MAG: CoB--CoM heterodisulfide reductase iron-sulfur subunit A family protein [Candidatus Lokiarchaeota archaeon]|nr:CoB--CoM heterodisulfide reductase iron-sulfur subunit A family protein [Candidatus Lokiarchaeota archaeon]
MEKIGAVLVIGGGIAGIQCSIDLADSGYKVYLAESTTSIGGVMSQLDKTFPTNDCAICILAPKLVLTGRHENIDILINSTIEKIEGEPGNFQVDLTQKTLYLDQEKCTGCGVCAQKCPIEAIDNFNKGLSNIAAISVKFPQAVPLVFSINKEKCIGCGICQGICKAEAIDYELRDKKSRFHIGAVVVAIGFDEYDPTSLKNLGYGKHLNVITSNEFERILSASGPHSGLILRPSDGIIPKKIAFLQCIGSRDKKHGVEYCSSVCCMYTTKEAVIAKEHMNLVEPTIFTMDIRAYGKDFDKYIERAREEYGIRYIRRRISTIKEVPDSKNLEVYYETREGKIVKEVFNLVVLSVGMQPSREAKELAQKLNIELNEYGFCKTNTFTPVETSRPGIYVCGAFASPKDIPETVIEASAAAGCVNVLLSEARNELISKKELPEEIDVSDLPPRIGVFICHCGINIGGVVNVPEVVNYVKALPDVAYAEHNLYTCSADTQTNIKEKIGENLLNRVIVASCTPRTHEPLFQATIKEAGLNKYLFEMVNIRDQCSWVHMHEAENATAKAKDLLRMSVAKARQLIPLQEHEIDVIHKGLIIGGGVSGMTAALNLASQGYKVFLVEKEDILGGFAKNIYYTLENNNVQEFLQNLIIKVENNPLIQVYTNAQVTTILGYIGNFSTNIIYGKNNESIDLEHGIIIVATGAKEYQPQEYKFGQDDRIISQSEFEKILFTTDKVKNLNSIVMIQCVGSRNEEHPYCSRICCSEAIKNALKAKKINPNLEVVMLYRDIRTYGFKEKYYNLAREKKVIFIRFDEEIPPKLEIKNKKLEISIDNPDLGKLGIIPDLIVLSNGLVAPSEENEELAKMLKVPLNEDKFFLEAHVKLRPIDFATDGIFLCGCAHSPKNISESIAQANGAAAQAVKILSSEQIITSGLVATVVEENCIGCGSCVEVCQFNAIELIEKEVEFEDITITIKKSHINSALCKGCGTCGANCPNSTIVIKHFGFEQISAMISALLLEN